MIKIPLVAFNQNETCYHVKYKVLLNVTRKVSLLQLRTNSIVPLLNLTYTHTKPGANKVLLIF